ncbi:MAG: Spy/CpxP family protein refolding chaperone [Syntrophales bacterium]
MNKTIAILLALFLLTQGTAMAANDGRGPSDRRMLGYGKGYDCSSLTANARLNLTAEQIARLRALDEKYAQEIEQIRKELHDKGRELKTEWLQTQPDRGRIEELRGETVKLRERLRAKLAAQRADALMVLTPEQQAQVPDEGPGRVFNIHKPAGFGRQ